MLTRRGVLAAALLPAAPAGTAAAAQHTAPLPHPAAARMVVAHGTLMFEGLRIRCSVGRRGVRRRKQEGDGATPAGVFPLREVLYRPDRGPAPKTGLPVSPTGTQDGWSDDPADPRYNRRTTMAGPFHREPLWRDDALYDILAVIGANDDPAIPGSGSAIFLHVASAGYGRTDGCVAVAKADLLKLLLGCAPDTEIAVRS